FVRVSCDSNPIHVDPIAARRLHAGVPIVHGVHALVWLLDCIARSVPGIAAARSLKVHFPQSIYVGDEATLQILDTSVRGIRARLVVETEEVLTASLSYDVPRRDLPLMSEMPTSIIKAPAIPQDLSL